MLRDFYNSVLEFIGTSSLTDAEFELSPVDLEPDYTKETFAFLKSVISARESVSDTYRRLYHVYYASGVIDPSDKPTRPASNIFIGSPL